MTETLEEIAIRAAREALMQKRARYYEGDLEAFRDVKPLEDRADAAEENDGESDIADAEAEEEEDLSDDVVYDDFAMREYVELHGTIPNDPFSNEPF